MDPLNTILLVQSCRCDNAGEDLVLDTLDISHAQNQEGMTTSQILADLVFLYPALPVAGVGKTCSHLCTLCMPVLHIHTGLSCMS